MPDGLIIYSEIGYWPTEPQQHVFDSSFDEEPDDYAARKHIFYPPKYYTLPVPLVVLNKYIHTAHENRRNASPVEEYLSTNLFGRSLNLRRIFESFFELTHIHSTTHVWAHASRWTHACGLTPHVGLTRKPDVRREADVRRNTVLRVWAHALRFFGRKAEFYRKAKPRVSRRSLRLTIRAATLPFELSNSK